MVELSPRALEAATADVAAVADPCAARRRSFRATRDDLDQRRSSDPDCRWIHHRLRRRRRELRTFLDEPLVPPDNNAAERDIRSVAAARAEDGVNREDWGAKAFGVAQGVVRTCPQNGLGFLRYVGQALRKTAAGVPPGLQLAPPKGGSEADLRSRPPPTPSAPSHRAA